jgi:4-carboxymuconolactone decarboxylase
VIPDISPRRRHAAIVSASLVNNDEKRLSSDLQNALSKAFSPAELVELILQSILFDGYPCALEGLILLKSILPEKFPTSELIEIYSPHNVQLWKDRGEDLCRQIYGKNYQPLVDNVTSLSPTLKEWMLREGYGRVLARPTLPIDLREMGIIAILTVKNLPRQLQSHLIGAIRVGVPRSELETVIELCYPYSSPDCTSTAQKILAKLS